MRNKLMALVAARAVTVSLNAREFPDITIADLKKAIAEKKATVIDVNGTDSYKAGHVPTAIDFAANEAQLKDKLPAKKDALVVAYCGGPSCSAYQAAAKKAKELGYTNVVHLSAGLSGWKAAKEKLETGK